MSNGSNLKTINIKTGKLEDNNNVENIKIVNIDDSIINSFN